jgi:replicative superfamily II helicase
MAKESNDAKEMQTAVRQILRNCTFDKIDVDKLPAFDVEYLFLQLRAKSVNNVVELQYRCENLTDENADVRCHAVNTVSIPLDEIKITVPEGHTTIVSISDDLTIEFKYPTVELLSELLSNGTISLVKSTELMASCIKTIIQKDGSVHEAQDSTLDELVQFVDSLTMQQVEQCQQFFATMPSLRYETNFTCTKCGYTEALEYEGLADFFV